MIDKLTPRLLTPIAVALVVSTLVAATAFVFVKTRDVRAIEVTGSAKRRITSDLIQWSAQVQAEDKDRVTAVRKLKEHVDKTKKYLLANGVTEAELRTSSTTAQELFETSVAGSGDDRVERTVSTGWRTTQALTVWSTDVTKVEKMSREVTDLLEQGVEVTSEEPEYHYTKLADLKIEMLAEASRDARTRADQMVAAAGGKGVGRLVRADMGVINVNPANSTETSWQGNNDTTSLDKDILTIVHISFSLD